MFRPYQIRFTQQAQAFCNSRSLHGRLLISARPTIVIPRAQNGPNHESLLAHLSGLTDQDLNAWAASNREQITLDFLGWVADKEIAAAGQEQEQLWALGSKLMTLREGFDAVSVSRAEEQLQQAASQAESSSSPSTSSITTTSNNNASGSMDSLVQQAAALGLSAQGMSLLEQQAAALEATIGIARSKSLVEIIGRAKVATEGQLQGVLEADAAGRILEVLMTMSSRSDRARALPDAFTPPLVGGGNSSDSDMYQSDEEEVYTTPFQLLQAVDLLLKRYQQPSEKGYKGLLVGSSNGMSREDVVQALQELREDIMSYWESGESAEEF